ncbi:MAG: hypothetical protein IT303_14245 [Dehalococcoidia bacterium]|nr:hypothetical protein [Dehalococcoidia bacterium]
MGFYYGSSTPPDDGNKPGGFKEAMLITWVVFRVLAVPLGILFGGIAYLLLIFYLFTIHPLAGVAGISLIFVAIGARAFWEWKNPPSLD